MNGQWWEFWDTRESMLLGVVIVEFVVRCKECGEIFAVRNLTELPDECPDCKR
jgi:predicted Zn-ribbon and HTH transcriptional regulator